MASVLELTCIYLVLILQDDEVITAPIGAHWRLRSMHLMMIWAFVFLTKPLL
uniref:Uncharacterized protein n=2 Tax=Felinae TaxID=338152 RepID=A0ABI7Z4A3_FELCA